MTQPSVGKIETVETSRKTGLIPTKYHPKYSGRHCHGLFIFVTYIPKDEHSGYLFPKKVSIKIFLLGPIHYFNSQF